MKSRSCTRPGATFFMWPDGGMKRLAGWPPLAVRQRRGFAAEGRYANKHVVLLRAPGTIGTVSLEGMVHPEAHGRIPGFHSI